MSDSKKSEKSIDEQLAGSLRTVLHFRITLPESYIHDAEATEKATKAFVEAIILKSKDIKGCELNHRASFEAPDGFNIPLI